ncbi:hypothetical protein TS85_23855 (plasmid) [Sphingomonas hengshuiensis]|uniref:Uncharacterized protein n=1 Tax=Sphingomonas hengshuiensis TaxID=1609977 RepID=A0A7U5BGH2_9SPHN|nr:hypothetical protein TS85_23855 [Sphingomonas hengshuiensis]
MTMLAKISRSSSKLLLRSRLRMETASCGATGVAAEVGAMLSSMLSIALVMKSGPMVVCEGPFAATATA